MNDVSKHFDKQNTQARILDVGFSSACSTIKPHILPNTLSGTGVSVCFLSWIFRSITQRHQHFALGNVKFKRIVTNTEAPQGCRMPLVLLSLYTDDCRNVFNNCSLMWYFDDTVILGTKSNDKCDEYVALVHLFVDRCKSIFLEVNLKNKK